MKSVRLPSILTVLVLASGCIDMDRWEIHYYVGSQNDVQVVHRFFGIHSSDDDREDNIEEMKEFYAEDHRALARDIAKDWRMDSPVVILTETRPDSCNAEVSGSYPDLVSALLPFLGRSNFIVERDSGWFSLHAKMSGADLPEQEGVMTLHIHYPESAYRQNAHVHHEDRGELVWDLGRLDSSGIRFSLKIE